MGVQPAVVITQALLDSILALVSLPALAVALVSQVGTSLNILNLCSQQPPPMPQLDPNLFNNSPASVYQALQSVAWPFFCQCVPGTPNPINFPPPTFTPPAGWPTAPTFTCDPAQLCATLERLEQLLNVVSGTVNSNYNLTTLIQRYQTPFAVIPSAFHTGLTGTGSIAVSSLIGVQYQVDQLPPTVRVTPGAPPYIRDLGWIGLELAAGGTAEHRVTRQQELWLPPTAQMANQLAWSLTPGTSITVRELLAEP